MDFIKKHKKGVKISGIIVAILLVIFIVKIFIFPSMGGNLYGSRLDGIDAVKVSDDKISKLKKEINDTGKADAVTYDLKGRIINIIINVKSSESKDEIKKLADLVLPIFTREQKEYYDIQVYLVQGDNTYIGYKHKTSDNFVWSNN